MFARAANLYKKVDLNSASKKDVLGRLYERLLRDLRDAGAAIELGDIAGKAQACDHASRIVTELTAALDHAAAAELCANLSALYGFVLDRIALAGSELRVKPLTEATHVVEVLRDAFAEASA